jgi:hypothetical protein
MLNGRIASNARTGRIVVLRRDDFIFISFYQVRNTDEESELNCCIRGYATTHLKSLTAVKKLRKPIGVCVTSKGGGFIVDFVVSAPLFCT